MTGDILYLQTADGEQLFVPDDNVKFLTYGGFGAPPVTFLTHKGYKQHGETEVDYLLEPRTVSVELWRAAGCTRQEYWDNRLALHEFLRHNRNGPLQFILREPGGKRRALTVRANPGLQFPMPGTDTNNWSVDEVIDFVAFDPVWFDPDTKYVNISSVLHQDLVFPITFPIVFGTYTLGTVSVTYIGTWKSYPTITVYGPYSSVWIENVTTGAKIILTTPVTGGDVRIITLTPGAQSIVDGAGANCFGDLSVDSDLVGFNLRPDPEVAGGIQSFQITFVGGVAGTSAVQLAYHERYFAI